MLNTKMDYTKIWSEKANKIMKNLVVKNVRWTTDEEIEDWCSKAPVIEFTNGLIVIASMDDEANNAGSLLTNHKDLRVLPVIYK